MFVRLAPIVASLLIFIAGCATSSAVADNSNQRLPPPSWSQHGLGSPAASPNSELAVPTPLRSTPDMPMGEAVIESMTVGPDGQFMGTLRPTQSGPNGGLMYQGRELPLCTPQSTGICYVVRQ